MASPRLLREDTQDKADGMGEADQLCTVPPPCSGTTDGHRSTCSTPMCPHWVGNRQENQPVGQCLMR